MVKTKRTLVNVHIEKTAGTSLLKFFEDLLGWKRIAFYDPYTDSVIRLSDLIISPSNEMIDNMQLKTYAFWPLFKTLFFKLQANKRLSKSIPKNIAVIHGHFMANRFDSILSNPLNTIVLRDPLFRMHSHFEHWKRSKGRAHWRVMIPYDSKMNFEDFSLLKEMQNYQTAACAGKDLNTFDSVGITEDMSGFLKKVYTMFLSEGHIGENVPLGNIKNMNQQNSRTLKIKKDFEKTFYLFHKDDYELYEQAKVLSHSFTLSNPSL